MNNKKILIIGAGAAGISAAVTLLENNIDNFLILEAENRIGGRINTIPIEDGIIELGAQWCHGEEDNIIYELSNKFNVFDSDNEKHESNFYFKSNGTFLDNNNKCIKKIKQIINQIIDDIDVENISKNYKGLSFGQYIENKFYEFLKINNENDQQKILAKEFLNYYQKYRDSIDGSDNWHETTLTEMTQYVECKGDRLLNWKNKGFKTILDILMKKFPIENEKTYKIDEQIHFNKCVNHIEWNKECVNECYCIRVTCEDGSVYEADQILITVSLGVLKNRHQQLFTPQLPILKQSTINGLAYGTVNKIFLQFSKPFWPNNWPGFNCLWTENDLENFSNCEKHDTDNESATANWWLKDIYSFHTLDYQPNFLQTWISGKSARKMEKIPLDIVQEQLMNLLRQFLSKWINIEDDVKPINIYRSTWFSNKHFYGSYSFRSLKSDELNVYADLLAEPICRNISGKPIIMFAGEATHSKYYSCVHGAIESGFREGKRISNNYFK